MLNPQKVVIGLVIIVLIIKQRKLYALSKPLKPIARKDSVNGIVHVHSTRQILMHFILASL
jgi:hypothetical protein